MNHNLQQQLYVPEQPLAHGRLLSTGKLRHFANIQSPAFQDQINVPSVVFASDPSLKGGPSLQMYKLWGGDPKNLIIFTDPSSAHPLINFNNNININSMRCRTINLPLELGLRSDQLHQLIRQTPPKEVIIVPVHFRPDAHLLLSSTRTHAHPQFVTDRALQRVDLSKIEPSPCMFEYSNAYLTPELAKLIQPQTLGRFQVAPVRATLKLRDHGFVIDVPDIIHQSDHNNNSNSNSNNDDPLLVPLLRVDPKMICYGLNQVL